MKNSHGFTLIEIMIVLVIIGITFGFALIAFGDFGASRRILFAAEQLVNTLELAKQQAILQTSTLGLRIDDTSYQILQLKKNTQWMPLSDKGVFKVTYFPKNTRILLKKDTNTDQKTQKAPEIIISSSGGLTPFTLSFGSTQEPNLAQLTGKKNGELIFNAGKTK